MIISIEMLKLIILIFLISFSTTQQLDSEINSKSQAFFPHTIWTFYNKDINEAPLLIQLAYNNIRHYAGLSNWKFNLVNDSNINTFLNERNSKVLSSVRDKREKNVQIENRRVLQSYLVMYEQGGMWVDLSCIFLHDLSWVDQLANTNLIYNAISSDPEVIFFTNDAFFSSNKTKAYDQKYQKEVKIFPGLQDWVFISKPKAKIFADVIDMLRLAYLKENLEELYKQNQKNGYQYLNEKKTLYFEGSYQLMTALQMKQTQIDQNLEDYKQGYAVEYYQIWCIDSRKTADLIEQFNFQYDRKVVKSFLYKPLEQLTDSESNPFIMRVSHAKQINDKLKQFLENQSNNCSSGVEYIPTDSIISLYLFQYSLDLTAVEQIKKVQASQKNWRCTLHNTKLQDLTNLLTLYKNKQFILKMLVWIFGVLGLIYMSRQIRQLIQKQIPA